jgi:hypothetical protein
MARRVYFAFHYQNDISRVNIVRNSGIIEGPSQAGFYDASLWEEAKKASDIGIKRMINKGLEGTTVTVFLLGSETARRRWVRYELEESVSRGNGMLAIYIHRLKDFHGYTCSQGENIFDTFTFQNSGRTLSTVYPVYDWVLNEGYNNFGTWVEQAAKQAGH